MTEKQIEIYTDLLMDKIVIKYGLSREDVKVAVALSAIQRLIREEPEYVDITPLEYWADVVYKEMLRKDVKTA